MQMNNAPFDWKTNKLGNVADVFDGTHQTPEYVDHGIKFISAEDISDPSASTKYITHQAFENNFKIRPNKNDIFMTRIGRIGIPFLLKTDEDFAYYVTLALLKLKRDVVPEYLFYFIQSNYFQFELWKRTLHVAFPEKINKDEIGKCLVLYPDNITEQKKIADILGTWDRAIEELTGLIAEKKELKRGLMQRSLSGTQRLPGFNKPWKEIILGDVADFYNGYMFTSDSYIKNGTYRIITIANVQRGFLNYCETNTITKLPADIQEYQILSIGDIIFSMTGNVGRVCTVSIDNCLLNQRVGKIVEKGVHKTFLLHILSTDLFVQKMISLAQGGAQDNISFKDVKKYKFNAPSDTEEQKAIADVLSEADSEIDLLNQQLDVLKEQKRGLMQKLLTGEIRVKVDTETC